MIVKFPDRAFRRREASRRQRNSKNGTPEERAEEAGPPRADRQRKPRRSKNGSPEERAARMLARSAKIIAFAPRSRPAASTEGQSTDDGAVSA